jgi:methylmalonyl-CoA/ethylmalonyl-CoA epimerase
MQGGTFHHLGIACRDIEKTRAWLRTTIEIVDESAVVHDHLQDVSLCILTAKDGVRYELVAGNKVNGIISKGGSYYHVCYEVPNVEQSGTNLAQAGCMKVLGPLPAALFDGRLVVFYLSPIGLIELLEQAVV